MAGVLNIKIKAGATYRRNLYFQDKNGNPLNLTGASPIGQLITQPAAAENIDLNIANGKLTITDAAEGKVTLLLAKSETNTFNWKTGRWWVNVSFPNGDEFDYIEGTVTITALGGG